MPWKLFVDETDLRKVSMNKMMTDKKTVKRQDEAVKETYWKKVWKFVVKP